MGRIRALIYRCDAGSGQKALPFDRMNVQFQNTIETTGPQDERMRLEADHVVRQR
jgi:hypothetical protein